jgi:hypothetical protein
LVASGGDVSGVISSATDALASGGSTWIDAASAAAGPAIEGLSSVVGSSGSPADGGSLSALADSAAAAAAAAVGVTQGALDASTSHQATSADVMIQAPAVKDAVKAVGDSVAESIRTAFGDSSGGVSR